jgi:transcription factor C subunit 7
MKQLQDRADHFIEAWTSRVEEMGARCVVIFAHAASVIALGRAVRLVSTPLRLGRWLTVS